MKTIGQSLLNLAVFVELSDDSIIDPDSAVKAMEQLLADLNSSDAGEREYLKGLMRQEIGSMTERSPEQQARVNFYLDLMEQLD
jgi:hypothetical protein